MVVVKIDGASKQNHGQRHITTRLLLPLVGLFIALSLSACGTVDAPQVTPIPTVAAPTATTPPTPIPTSTATLEPPTITPVPTVTMQPTVHGTETPPPLAWREARQVAPGKKQIALTFDAGASGETMPLILQTLRERKLRVTMFLTGKFAERYSQSVRQAALDGHELANHTYSHRDSTRLTDDQLKSELARAEQVIRNLTGVSTKPYWRPPYGARNNHVLNVAVSQGYRSIFWSLDSHDAVGKPKTADFIFERITNPQPKVELDGAIVLHHFGAPASAEALPRILDRFNELGLKVVTVSELLKSP